MTKVRYVKEPGFVYDLMFIFVLYFNKEAWIKKFVNTDKEKDDINFYNEILDKFPAFPEELKPFFYLKDDKSCLMTECYFQDGFDCFFNGYGLNYLYTELSDTEKLKANIIKFYLPNVGDMQNISTYDLNKSLIKSHLPETIKQWLLAILSDVKEYSQMLIECLSSVEKFVDEYHKEHFSDIVKLRDGFELAEAEDIFKPYDREFDFDENDFELSVCLIMRNLIRFDFISEKACFILGKNGREYAQYVDKNNNTVDLLLFGKIISDKNRVKVLQMLAKRPEMTTGAITRELGTSLPTSYYHLEMMLSAGMLSVRNEGRTVFYSIRQDYFCNANNSMSRLVKKGEILV